MPPVPQHLRPTDAELRAELEAGAAAALADPLVAQIADITAVADGMGYAHLDPELDGDGGAAFLWEDLLTLGDVAGAAGSLWRVFTDPAAQAKVLLKLVLFWRNLRGKRVMLDGPQYRVMKAVKNKPGTRAAVAAALAKPQDVVDPVVDVLRKTEYRDGIMLLEQDAAGVLSTRF